MIRRPPESTRNYPLFPCPTLFRSPGEKAPRGLPFIRRLALGEIGIAQPVPVAVGYQRRDHGLVAQQIGLPRREGVLIEVHVRPGVIAEHLPRGAPRRLVL